MEIRYDTEITMKKNEKKRNNYEKMENPLHFKLTKNINKHENLIEKYRLYSMYI